MFKVDFLNGEAITWSREGSAVIAEKHRDYHPRFYINGEQSKLHKARSYLGQTVESARFENWQPTLSTERQLVLRVDCRDEESLKTSVNTLKKKYGRSTFTFYNVGLSPQFRYCLQNRIKPVPNSSLNKLELNLHRKHLAQKDLDLLHIDGETSRNEKQNLKLLKRKLKQKDPDILIVNRGQLLNLLTQKIRSHDLDFSLGRMKNFQTLAGGNTVSSYGRTQHSSARYNIPGRIIIDRSNSFMLGEATIKGLWDLVERSYRPLQELAWASIGRILTSIEIKKAYLEEDILTPWKNWEGEQPKKALTLHKADRGGFIFNPQPSIHYDVYEADFASLFPNIMVKKNISPETVCCDCCDNSRVPELGYSICQNHKGFISKVLNPLVEDRQEMKQIVEDIEDETRRNYIQGSIDALKWILVSCFGYMGHSHASYGAIRCHQAIQAYDREIMLEAKEIFEESGYKVAHGIIDSIWVQERETAERFEEVCNKISEEIGIELEPENKFEWVAFVPRSSTEADIATLNRYFGKREDGTYKTAGIETEQSSTPKYIKDCQMEMIKALDKDMAGADVIDKLRKQVLRLKSGEVSVEELVVERKTSKPLEAYQVENRTVAAIKRAKQNGITVKPGQKVRFWVYNDSFRKSNRVRLDFENSTVYDEQFYIEELVRAAGSILSPLGWDRGDIRQSLESYSSRSVNRF